VVLARGAGCAPPCGGRGPRVGPLREALGQRCHDARDLLRLPIVSWRTSPHLEDGSPSSLARCVQGRGAAQQSPLGTLRGKGRSTMSIKIPVRAATRSARVAGCSVFLTMLGAFQPASSAFGQLQSAPRLAALPFRRSPVDRSSSLRMRRSGPLGAGSQQPVRRNGRRGAGWRWSRDGRFWQTRGFGPVGWAPCGATPRPCALTPRPAGRRGPSGKRGGRAAFGADREHCGPRPRRRSSGFPSFKASPDLAP
jgi:hypothetical protein